MLDSHAVPMLCTPSKTVAATPEAALAQLQKAGWHFEPKLDGIRALVYVDGGEVRLVNRRGATITGRYPEVVSALQQTYPDRQLVLDAEIVCYGEDGRADFSRIHRRDALSPGNTHRIALAARQMPATMVAFDVLYIDGQDLRERPYTARLVALRELHVDGVLQTNLSDLNGAALWSFVVEHGLEGLIAKRPNSRYQAGRSSDWIKLKRVDTVSVVAIGYEPGQGHRAGTIGAVHIALLDGDSIVNVGRVGTGFRERDLADLKRRMDAGEVLVLEVEYANWGATSRKLRFPSYRGLRSDVLPTDCTVDQLNPTLRLGDDAVEALAQR